MAHGMTLPPFRLGLPTSINPPLECPHRHAQWSVPSHPLGNLKSYQVDKINHYSYFGSWFQKCQPIVTWHSLFWFCDEVEHYLGSRNCQQRTTGDIYIYFFQGHVLVAYFFQTLKSSLGYEFTNDLILKEECVLVTQSLHHGTTYWGPIF